MARGRWRLALGTGMALILGLGSVGCGSKAEPSTPPAAAPAAPGTTKGPAESQPASRPKVDPRLKQTFVEATIQDPPPGWQRPPDTTITGKSVGKIYTEVERLWNSIAFVSDAGKRIEYTATLETDQGPITIVLLPELAPNHVRSFVALAEAGYYDGLLFERIVHADPKEQPNMQLELIEAGCPIGTGELGYGSLGYWLKPEFNSQVQHEPGTVGACHGPEEDVSGCKFYINLCKAPFMDGNFTVFGKVVQGLDVAHRILAQPVRNDAENPEGDRPVNPVVIRKVTVRATDGDNAPTK